MKKTKRERLGDTNQKSGQNVAQMVFSWGYKMLWLLDYVLFVGTVKNVLEGFIAYAHHDRRRANEKWTFAVLGGVLDFFTLGGETYLCTFGALATRGVQRAVKKGVQITATRASVNVGGRLLCKKICEQTKSPSKKGEHVINNVIKVYRDIVETFVEDVMDDKLDDMIESKRLSENSSVNMLINHPVPDDVENFIRGMSVFITGPFYVDTNSDSYGQEIEMLRNVVVAYMSAFYDGLRYHNFCRVPGMESNVRDTVEQFIAGNYFVDKRALELWLSEPGNTEQKFERIRQEVINMFRRLIYDDNDCMVITWVRELWEARETITCKV